MILCNLCKNSINESFNNCPLEYLDGALKMGKYISFESKI